MLKTPLLAEKNFQGHYCTTLSVQASKKLLPPALPVSVPRRPSTKPSIVQLTPNPPLVPVLVLSSNCGVAPVASVPMSKPAFLIARMPSPPFPEMSQSAISACAFRSTRIP